MTVLNKRSVLKIAAISIVGPIERIPPDRYNTVGEKTAAAARIISGI